METKGGELEVSVGNWFNFEIMGVESHIILIFGVLLIGLGYFFLYTRKNNRYKMETLNKIKCGIEDSDFMNGTSHSLANKINKVYDYMVETKEEHKVIKEDLMKIKEDVSAIKERNISQDERMNRISKRQSKNSGIIGCLVIELVSHVNGMERTPCLCEVFFLLFSQT